MAKKKKAHKKVSTQEQLQALCNVVNTLSVRVAELQLTIGALREQLNPPPMPGPWTWPVQPWTAPSVPAPYQVTCSGHIHGREEIVHVTETRPS